MATPNKAIASEATMAVDSELGDEEFSERCVVALLETEGVGVAVRYVVVGLTVGVAVGLTVGVVVRLLVGVTVGVEGESP